MGKWNERKTTYGARSAVGQAKGLKTQFIASEGAGSHGTFYVGNRKTTVKDRKKEIGKGLLNKMLADLGIPKDDFP